MEVVPRITVCLAGNSARGSAEWRPPEGISR